MRKRSILLIDDNKEYVDEFYDCSLWECSESFEMEIERQAWEGFPHKPYDEDAAMANARTWINLNIGNTKSKNSFKFDEQKLEAFCRSRYEAWMNFYKYMSSLSEGDFFNSSRRYREQEPILSHMLYDVERLELLNMDCFLSCDYGENIHDGIEHKKEYGLFDTTLYFKVLDW